MGANKSLALHLPPPTPLHLHPPPPPRPPLTVEDQLTHTHIHTHGLSNVPIPRCFSIELPNLMTVVTVLFISNVTEGFTQTPALTQQSLAERSGSQRDPEFGCHVLLHSYKSECELASVVTEDQTWVIYLQNALFQE